MDKKLSDMSRFQKVCFLFVNALIMSTVTFGGGYPIVSMIKKKYVDQLHWIEEEEMLNLTAVAQSSPGAIVINTSMLVGFKISGFAGAAATVIGAIIPPLVIISVISVFYSFIRDNVIVSVVLRGMQAGVAAVIVDAVLSLGWDVVKKKQLVSYIVMVAVFVLTVFFNVNVILLLVGSACAGIGGGLVTKLRQGRNSN